MQSRKIYHLLSLLGPEDQDKLTLFLNSPYFNSSKTLSLFWKQWRNRVLNSTKGADLSVEAFIKGTSLKASRFDKLCSQLTAKVNEFLALQAFEESSMLKEVFASVARLKRDQEMETAPGMAEKTQDYLDKQPLSPDKYLASLYHEIEVTEAWIRARKHAPDFQRMFLQMMDHLEQFATSKRLRLGVAGLNSGFIYQQIDSPFQDAIRERLHSALEELPSGVLARLYALQMRMLLDEEAEASFKELLSLLEHQSALLKQKLAREIYNYALNHCIRQINLGNEKYLDYTMDIYVQLVKQGHILVDGKLSPVHLKNITVLGCRVGRLEWVEQFIDDFVPSLEDDHDGVAEVYNLAVLRFHQARYSEAIDRFKTLILESKHDVFYGMDARMYLWKAYFEHLDHLNPDEIDEMYKLYDSFRLYVDRNKKISELHQLQYRNFIRLFKRFIFLLLDQGLSRSREELLAFQEELLATEDISNKTWFVRKVEEALAAG